MGGGQDLGLVEEADAAGLGSKFLELRRLKQLARDEVRALISGFTTHEAVCSPILTNR